MHYFSLLEEVLQCTAPLNFWTACIFVWTIHSAENSAIFESPLSKEDQSHPPAALVGVLSCLPLQWIRINSLCFYTHRLIPLSKC